MLRRREVSVTSVVTTTGEDTTSLRGQIQALRIALMAVALLVLVAVGLALSVVRSDGRLAEQGRQARNVQIATIQRDVRDQFCSVINGLQLTPATRDRLVGQILGGCPPPGVLPTPVPVPSLSATHPSITPSPTVMPAASAGHLN